MEVETEDPALRAANQALTGKRQRDWRHLAMSQLPSTDPKTRPWEFAAMASVAIGALLLVLALWFY